MADCAKRGLINSLGAPPLTPWGTGQALSPRGAYNKFYTPRAALRPAGLGRAALPVRAKPGGLDLYENKGFSKLKFQLTYYFNHRCSLFYS